MDDLQIATDWLRRSGQLSLSILLSEFDDDDAEEIEPSQRAANCLSIDLINQHSTRWDFLEIEGLPETTSLVGNKLHTAPNLRLLSVQNADDDDAIFGGMPSGMKPRPKTL